MSRVEKDERIRSVGDRERIGYPRGRDVLDGSARSSVIHTEVFPWSEFSCSSELVELGIHDDERVVEFTNRTF